MLERSEMDKIIQTPVKVILGGGEYEVKPLPIKYSVTWVKKLLKLFINTASLAKIEANDNSAIEAAITHAMVDNPEQLAELFWEYAKLDRAKLEEIASSSEVMTGFKEVLKFELPFLLGMNALSVISPKAQPSN